MILRYEIHLDESQWKGRDEQLEQVLNDTAIDLEGSFNQQFWYRHGFRPDYEISKEIAK